MLPMAKSSARRLLFVVSRDRTALYEALRTALWSEMDCEIILDRRQGDRRQDRGWFARPSSERRAAHRRQRALVDREISEFGWAVVNVATWPEDSVDRIRRG
jgi:hypothetical protein